MQGVLLCHDQVPNYTSGVVKDIMVKGAFELVEQPPYPPNLTPSDY